VFREPPATKEAHFPARGLLVQQVSPNSTAIAAGLKPGDELLKYNGTELEQATDIKDLPKDDKVETIAVEVWRDGHTTTRRVEPGPLGIVLAKEPASIALREQQRLDAALLAVRSGGDFFCQLPATVWRVMHGGP
jgi:membrane-associated protease RseP (regulator of RpoE activity)